MADYREQLKVLGENCEILNERIAFSDEQRGICVMQICESLCARGTELGVDGVYSEFMREMKNATPSDKAMLCQYICKEKQLLFEVEEKKLFGDGEKALEGTLGRIAYVKNKRSDEVFLELSRRLTDAKAYYASSFIDACELVFNNVCEFCIIPIENNNEGKLYSFYAMLDRYELKICNIVRKENEDASDSVTFALAGRGIDVPVPSEQALMRFEFSVVYEKGYALEAMISAIVALGGKISSIGTLPVPYDDKKSRCYMAVDIQNASPLPMALYMNMEYPRYIPMGLYAVIE